MSAFGGDGMPTCVLAAAVNRTRRAIQLAEPDGELVERFTSAGDQDAFAQLVHRHGPMVLAVCRRITRHVQDAEDAFQATFHVLARKAGTLNPAGAVAGWLFGVAVKAAGEARKRTGRRTARESLMATLPETGRCDPEPTFEVCAAVAEELAGLPERYRSLVVACDLEGEPQATAARRLGIPAGTVYSRLSTARRLLADRLRQRGGCRAGGDRTRPHSDGTSIRLRLSFPRRYGTDGGNYETRFFASMEIGSGSALRGCRDWVGGRGAQTDPGFVPRARRNVGRRFADRLGL
jgi:RNA polymerase sigma factor (sigma-70 family)